jgi:hypothetical protein
MTLRQDYEARKLRQVRPGRELKDRVAVIAIVISAFGLILNLISSGVAITALQLNRQTLVASNRAWIAPLGIDLTGPFEFAKDLPFNVAYANLGKSPAIVEQKYYAVTVPRSAATSPTAPILLGENSTCDELTVPTTGGVVFSDNKDHWYISHINGENLTAGVLSGDSYLILRGCIKYRTLGEIHESGVCYVAKKGDQISSRGNTTLCGDGNFAD